MIPEETPASVLVHRHPARSGASARLDCVERSNTFLHAGFFRYFIPEDGDIETQPNVFLAPKPRQQGYPPTLGQVKNAFPLPGRYHFRFKSPLIPGSDRDKGALPVWMDCVDDRQHVPTWKATIVAKVTRIGVEEDDDEDDDDDFVRHTSASSAPSSSGHAAPARQPSLDIFDGPSPTHHAAPQAHAPAPASGHHDAAPNLLDAHPPAPASGTPASSGSRGDTLLDMNYGGHHAASTATSSSAHADFLGMTTPPVSGGYPQAQAPPPQQQQQRPPQQQNAFNSFSQQRGPFGDLGQPWKN